MSLNKLSLIMKPKKERKTSLFSWDSFRRGSGWIFLIAGVALYFLGFVVLVPDSSWSKLVLRVADLLILGVLLGYITNSARYMGAFKQDLESIIYGKEFVSKRNDLYLIWERVSQTLFGNRFPEISGDLLSTLKQYFPEKDEYYYNNHDILIKLQWHNKKNRILVSEETHSLKIISETINKINYDFHSRTSATDKDDYECNLPIEGITINGIPCKKEQITHSVEQIDGAFRDSWNLTLEGSTNYIIKYRRTKKYRFDDDFFLGFWAKRMVLGLRVSLILPNDLDAIFVPRGILGKFEDDISNGNSDAVNKTIAKKYEGIILKKQGFVIPLKQKKS